MRARDEHVRLGSEQGLEHEVLAAQHLLDDLVVSLGEIDDPQLAFHARNVLDDLVRLLLAQGEVVAEGVELAYDVDKRVDGERIMLTGDGEVGDLLRLALVFLLQKVGLLEHLPGISQKRLTLRRHHDALVRAFEDDDAHLVLQVADRGGDGRLRHEQASRRLSDVAHFGDFHDVFQLLQFHGRSSPAGHRGSRIGENDALAGVSRKECKRGELVALPFGVACGVWRRARD